MNSLGFFMYIISIAKYMYIYRELDYQLNYNTATIIGIYQSTYNKQ